MNIFNNVFDNLSYPVLVIDQDYAIMAANSATSKNFGVVPESIIGQPCYAVTHGFKQPCWLQKDIRCPTKEAFETKQRVKAIHSHLTNDKQYLEEIIATPLMTDGGAPYVVEEMRNMTELFGLKNNVLPICSWCNLVRDADGNWVSIEEYIMKHAGADSSHSICPECLKHF